MFAVIKSGGRQYKVAVGQTLEVNRLPAEDGKQISISEVLLISDADNSLVGAPFVANAEVLATVNGQKRGKKVIIFRYKAKKRVRHRRGHRQELTVLTIDDIVSEGKSLITGEAPQAKATPVVEEEAPETTTTAEEQTAPAEEAAEGKKTTRRRRTTKAESSTEE
jgi:large subunit ribosomal protein L21